MRRRTLLKRLAALPLLPVAASPIPVLRAAAPERTGMQRRVRPSDPDWPDAARWEQLNRAVGGRLVKVSSPLDPCRHAPKAALPSLPPRDPERGSGEGAACRDLFRELKNPYFVGDQVNLTQTTGWVDAWSLQPSVYAVAAQTARDVIAAVNFARDHNLRLVIKGGGHSYLGTSNAPDSLLIWTRRMNATTLHDGFVAAGCAGREAPQPAVSVGAGAIWGHTYNKVTTTGARYVQGGGCLTVGVAGLVQAGGFGSFSKNFGIAAAGLLEAEIVTADGRVRTANSCTNPDLFWALKGGGGGSFGVMTRLTLRTHPLPPYFGALVAMIEASSEAAFRRLLGRFVDFYAESLLNPHWGEIVTLRPGNRIDIRMAFQGLTQQQAELVWQPFFEWVTQTPADFAFRLMPRAIAVPARHLWDPIYLKAFAPGVVISDERSGAPVDNIFWTGNLAEAGHFIYGYQSVWLPQALLRDNRRALLADGLAAAARLAPVELHMQKGLAGGSEQAISATRETAMNPAVLDAFALAIIGGEGPPALPGLPGHEPDLAVARRQALRVGEAMRELKKVAPPTGAYCAESDFFEPQWQTSYWGPNYPRLRSIKAKYDAEGLFFVHHGVGSEEWSADGFTRVTARD